MALPPIPDDRPRISPYLVVTNAAQLIDFAERLFNGKVIQRIRNEDGLIVHAEIQIGNSTIMVGQASDNNQSLSAMVHIYVEDVDGTHNRSIDMGAKTFSEPTNQVYGERTAGIIGPQGNFWWLASKIEDLTEEEIQKRLTE